MANPTHTGVVKIVSQVAENASPIVEGVRARSGTMTNHGLVAFEAEEPVESTRTTKSSAGRGTVCPKDPLVNMMQQKVRTGIDMNTRVTSATDVAVTFKGVTLGGLKILAIMSMVPRCVLAIVLLQGSWACGGQ